MGPIYDSIAKYETGYKCLGISILLAAITCAFSTLCAIIISYMDLKREKFLKRFQKFKDEKVKPADKIRLQDALYFPLELWLIIIICVVFYSATFPFISLGKLFFIRKYNFSPTISSLQQRFNNYLNYYKN
jgi:hypothetical protein